MSYTHFDSVETAFFEQELQSVKAQTYNMKFPNLKARTFIPVSGGDPGATTVAYDQFEDVGRSKIVGNNPQDIPRVDLKGQRFNRPVREVANAYGWTVKEIRSAAMAGRPLNSMKAAASLRATEELLDSIACFGSPDYGIVDGFLNNAAVPVTAVGGGNDWATLAGTAAGRADIVAQFSSSIQRIVAATNGVEMPNTALIPTAEYALIATTPFGDNSDKTILDFLLSSFRELTTIEPWYRMNAAGAAGVTRMVIYDRSPNILTQDITAEYEQLPAQEAGLEMVVNTLASTAGTAMYYPLAADFSDGI